MSSNSALVRLTKELKQSAKERVPGVIGVRPNAGNSFEIHFVIEGEQSTHYYGGQYWGKLVMPPTYPNAPPDLIFFTPSGRFVPGKKVCTSFTAYHPETWSPLWTLNNLLLGIISFMNENASTAGSIDSCSYIERRELAAKSWEFNAKSPLFQTIFPDLCDGKRGVALMKEVLAERALLNRQMLWATSAGVVVVFSFVILRVLGIV